MAQTVSVEAITRRRRRFRMGWVLWPLVIVALAAGGYFWFTRAAARTAAVHYVTAPAKTGDITVTVTAVGTVEPIQQVDVASLISGTIAEIDVDYNDKVTKGQVLARLDTSSLEAELARDQATLTAQKSQVEDAKAAQESAVESLDRAQESYARGLIPEEDLRTALTAKRRADAALAMTEAQVQVAEASVKLSQTNLDKAAIVAPIDGMVLDRQADVGQTVSATASTTVTLFTLAHDLGEMQLSVNVDEGDIGKVATGNPATFTVDAYMGESFPAKVSEMHFAPQTVDGIVTYPTILAIDNSDHRLRPGMTASADIKVQEVKGALTVPNAAFRYAPPVVQADAQQSSGLLGVLFSGAAQRQKTTVTNKVTKEGYRTLYVLRDGAPAQVSVKTGVTDGDTTEVLDGPLQPGDAVITAQTAGSK